MGAVVAGLCAVKEGLPDAVFHFELLQQVGHFSGGTAGGFVIGTALVQGFKVDGRAGRGQGRHKQGGDALDDVEHRLGQPAHGSRVGHMEPLVAVEKFDVGVDEGILVGFQLVVVGSALFIELPGSGHGVFHR